MHTCFYRQIEQQMQEVSTMVSLISEHLSSQQEDIQHVLEAAETSTALVNQVGLGPSAWQVPHAGSISCCILCVAGQCRALKGYGAPGSPTLCFSCATVWRSRDFAPI